ncbi:unsaturated glucuronyl hydrolase [Marvinbryantia formatexigens DSM 14469]|uniref:Unsaturated glucuronyl hydrolase n=1 Tax=Marvinbryantia formatexigens DSM 14469 TaxID=478749 RepID=C6LLL6_9FIRM|nr:glycoside hydrolase family 88 protein [Marvinbryantia formatexigens]EET58480.1 unsaturated glucuronyl hydrolase [Marvinbryantia formatexigens DSM 14469]UWO26797.1 glycoside hydrolase family 88 protein [Marvinbryantia formatexigens DSM 14469]SDH17216.1 unsaturated chondroitin disaccharide hydrolase [Marvinbryantia formatexigens]
MEEKKWAGETAARIVEKMRWVSEKNKEKIPYTTDENGDYDDRSDKSRSWNADDGLSWWTNGFWGGMMWLLYLYTKEERYAEIARVSEDKMTECFQTFLGLHHDVGFMFQPTAVADYRITGRRQAKTTALHAAALLAGRFNPAGNYIRAWNDISGSTDDTRGWAIIDCMFNISLLYWASEETKDPRFRHIAMLHADTVRKNFVREDGSVCHIVEFDPETGERVKSYGGQGYAEGSAWTRGQGWAVYGFMISYRHTGKKEYLEMAKKVAQYCIAHIPEDGIIPVDFCQPAEPAWEDSCGACVIAGGLLSLAEQTEGEEKQRYLENACKILKTIAAARADWGTDCDAIVQNCSASYHDKKHHVTMNYADYFFMEAVFRLAGMEFKMW